MRILVIGGTGTIGQSVAKELSLRHEVIIAAREHGEVRVDIADKNSIEMMFQTVGKVDAVVSTTGKVHFGAFHEITEAQYALGLNNKLMGQVNLVSIGLNYLNDRGSFTLTSGILNRDPIRLGSSASMVNGAIDGFVKAAAIEMPRGLRINVVSPTVVSESMDKYADFFRGFEPVSAARVALAYVKSVEGAQTGQIYCVI
ncbi:short chain dehydrogenase [Legionella waltersii]|uniref:Dehydrogenase n=1 Tax=Legionella waltersii TaxID=66969 RepID=A0A0W1ANY8_9GAMM|nr:short chain dehydrogenase [Legionella waltersii]KTD83067.1 dehydrogenase [Legionella waltersii]SNV08172.1 dehydrogenase [Legionella waltersii]